MSATTVRWSDDTAKSDPELVCDDCGEVLCDVEHGDTLAALVAVASQHRLEEHPDAE